MNSRTRRPRKQSSPNPAFAGGPGRGCRSCSGMIHGSRARRRLAVFVELNRESDRSRKRRRLRSARTGLADKAMSINELTTYRWTFEEDVSSLARRQDSSRQALASRKLSDFGEEKAVELIKDSLARGVVSSGPAASQGGRRARVPRCGRRGRSDSAGRSTRSECLVLVTGPRGDHTQPRAVCCSKPSRRSSRTPANTGCASRLEPMHPHCAATGPS